MTIAELDKGCKKVMRLWHKGRRPAAFALCKELVADAGERYGIPAATLGQLYGLQFDFEEAAYWYGQGAVLSPDNLDIWSNLSSALCEAGQMNDAAYAAANVLGVCPEHKPARYAMAHVCLKVGIWREAWSYWQEGFYLDKFSPRCPKVGTLWNGEPIPGSRLFVHWSQGLGDTIQFLRFIPMILDRAQADSVVLEVQPALVGLCQDEWGDRVEIVAYDHSNPTNVPEFDYKVDLMHAPHFLGLESDYDHSMHAPYLGSKVEPAILSGMAGNRKIGVAWQGNKTQERDALRSVPSDQITQLFDVQTVDWFTLQKDESLDHPGARDIGMDMPTMREAVAYLKGLDLFITVDTGIAHLALACGVKTWVLLQKYADWRWQDRESTVWYPDARLFRCTENRNWQPILESVRQHVRVFAA